MDLVSKIYELYDSSKEFRDLVEKYHKDTKTQLVLLVFNEKIAKAFVDDIKEYIKDKIVLEIGAGIGLLAMEMSKYAKEVFAIEKDPAWTWVFVKELYRRKPKNLTFIFGEAEKFIDIIKPNVIVIYSCSGLDYLIELAKKYKPKKILLNSLPVT